MTTGGDQEPTGPRRTPPSPDPTPAAETRPRTVTPPPPAAEGYLRPGMEIANYRIVEALGRGGMGQVFRARQLDLGGREVALKVVHPHLVRRDPRYVTRFRREAELAATIRSPHIAQVYAFGGQGDRLHLAMELIEGPTLQEELDRLVRTAAGGAPIHHDRAYMRRAVQLVATLAGALGRVHRLGLIHRDVKPANVLLRRPRTPTDEPLAGEPVLVDFGLLRPIPDSDLTGRHTLLHTPAYAAPEARLGKRLDARADVYSLGRVLYDLLTLPGRTARIPDRVTAADLRLRHPHLGPDLAAIAAMALQENPVHRYEDGAALARELEAHLTDRPLRARPPSALGRTVLALRRDPWGACRRTARLGARLLLVTGLVGAAGWVAQTYHLAARAQGDLATGRLPVAIATWDRLARRPWTLHRLPGLEGTRRRVAALLADPDLRRLPADLAAPDRGPLRRAHRTLHRYLFPPGREAWRPGIRRHLVATVEGHTQGRGPTRAQALAAARTLAHYALHHPDPFHPADRKPLADRTEGVLLAALDRELAAAGKPGEYRYHLVSALHGPLSRKGYARLVDLLDPDDPERLRLAQSALEYGLQRARQRGGEKGIQTLIGPELVRRTIAASRRTADELARRPPTRFGSTLRGSMANLLYLLHLDANGGDAPLPRAWFGTAWRDAALTICLPPLPDDCHPDWVLERWPTNFHTRIRHGFLEGEGPFDDFDPLWEDPHPALSESRTETTRPRHRLANPTWSTHGRALCTFVGSTPRLYGPFTWAEWNSVRLTHARTQDGLGKPTSSFLLLDNPGRSRLRLGVRVPPFTSTVNLRATIVPSVRGPLPWTGRCELRLRYLEWNHRVDRTLSWITLDEHALDGSLRVQPRPQAQDLTLELTLVDGDTLCRVERIELHFEGP